VWWYKPRILVLWRWWKEDCTFQARLDYIVRLYLKNKAKKHKINGRELDAGVSSLETLLVLGTGEETSA
jgi:hypothetical protein